MAAIEGWKGSGKSTLGRGCPRNGGPELETLALSCLPPFRASPPPFPPPRNRHPFFSSLFSPLLFLFSFFFSSPELRLRWVETRQLRSRPIGSRLRLWSAPAEAALAFLIDLDVERPVLLPRSFLFVHLLVPLARFDRPLPPPRPGVSLPPPFQPATPPRRSPAQPSLLLLLRPRSPSAPSLALLSSVRFHPESSCPCSATDSESYAIFPTPFPCS